MLATFDKASLDLGAPLGECADDLRRHALDLGRSPPHRCPLDTERSSQRPTEMCLVEVAGGLGLGVDPPSVECAPPPVARLGHVGDQHVGVEQGIAGARGSVPEARGDEALAGVVVDPARPPAGSAGLSLEVGERCSDRLLVCLGHRGGDILLTERVQQRDRLRCPEGEIEARQTTLVHPLGELLETGGMEATEDRTQLFGPHLARQPHASQAPTQPPS